MATKPAMLRCRRASANIALIVSFRLTFDRGGLQPTAQEEDTASYGRCLPEGRKCAAAVVCCVWYAGRSCQFPMEAQLISDILYLSHLSRSTPLHASDRSRFQRQGERGGSIPDTCLADKLRCLVARITTSLRYSLGGITVLEFPLWPRNEAIPDGPHLPVRPIFFHDGLQVRPERLDFSLLELSRVLSSRSEPAFQDLVVGQLAVTTGKESSYRRFWAVRAERDGLNRLICG